MIRQSITSTCYYVILLLSICSKYSLQKRIICNIQRVMQLLDSFDFFCSCDSSGCIVLIALCNKYNVL